MRAAFTPAYGPSDVLELRAIPRPQPGPRQVLVNVHVSVVSAGDRRLRSADFPSISALPGRLMMGVLRPRHPVQGTMFAGRVAEVGAQVTRFKVGDEVFGQVDNGAWAEAVLVDAEGPIALRPDKVSREAAAALSYGAGTALHFLDELAQVQPGEEVLILGGSGGVGRYAIQIARWLGAVVTAVGSEAHHERMKALGAHQVHDHRSFDYTRAEQRWDVVFDIADCSSFPQARERLNAGGRYLTLTIRPGHLFWMLASRLVGDKHAVFNVAIGDRENTERLAQLASEDILAPTIAARFPLEQIAQAHACAESGARGSVVVEVTPPFILARSTTERLRA